MSCETRNLQRGLHGNRETLRELQSKIVFLKQSGQKGTGDYSETLKALKKTAGIQRKARKSYHFQTG